MTHPPRATVGCVSLAYSRNARTLLLIRYRLRSLFGKPGSMRHARHDRKHGAHEGRNGKEVEYCLAARRTLFNLVF
jgi:hypothetical protein